MSLALWLLVSQISHAALDPVTGARVSLATTQKMLAAPFLPNLRADRPQRGVQAAYVLASLKGGGGGDPYRGAFAGPAFGVSWSPALSRGLGYTASASYSRITGAARFDGESSGSHAFDTSTYNASIVANARLYGHDDDTSIVGAWAGPALLHFKSRLGIQENPYLTDPYYVGVTAGVQWRVRWNNWMFNPYALTFQTFQRQCTHVDASGPIDAAKNACPGDPGSIDLMPTFNAYGLILGYRKLQLNVYARVLNDSSLSDTSVFNLAFSYSF